MKTTVLANQKGGVGKSAVACQWAYYLASQDRRVLVLDLDHQRNSTAAVKKSEKADLAPFTSSQLSAERAAELPDAPFVLVPGDDALSWIEREPEKHKAFVNGLKSFLNAVADRFDVCLIDTNPNPDVRYASALVVADYVLSPVQLNQEALDGISALLTHPRYGYAKIKKMLNPSLELIGILPNMVESKPFQRQNFEQLANQYAKLLIPMGGKGGYALIPNRTAVAEAQAAGLFIGEMPKTSARNAWREIRPTFDVLAQRMELALEA